MNKSNIEKPTTIEGAIRQDFEQELRDVDFPLKSLIINDNNSKEVLFEEFVSLAAEPKLQLYIRDFITEDEWIIDYENRTLPASNTRNVVANFHELKSTAKLESKYFGRFIKNTNTVNALEEIANKLEGLKNYIFLNTNVQGYGDYAKVVADTLLNEAETLPLAELRQKIIQHIIADNENFLITVKHLNPNFSDGQIREALARYEILKTFLNSFLRAKLKAVINTEKDSCNSVLKWSSNGYISYNDYEVNCSLKKGEMFSSFHNEIYEL